MLYIDQPFSCVSFMWSIVQNVGLYVEPNSPYVLYRSHVSEHALHVLNKCLLCSVGSG